MYRSTIFLIFTIFLLSSCNPLPATLIGSSSPPSTTVLVYPTLRPSLEITTRPQFNFPDQSVGFIVIPGVGDAGNYYLDAGSQIDLIWDSPPQNSSRYDFIMLDASDKTFVIGTDTDPSDGVSVVWRIPENLPGFEVMGIAYSSEGQAVYFAYGGTVYSGDEPPQTQPSLAPSLSPSITPTEGQIPIPTPVKSTEIPTPSLSPGQTGVLIRGNIMLDDGSGLADVRIYLSLAAYSGEIIATTDSNGDFQSGLKFIPGDENVTVWAELDGYSFNPPIYYWRHYYGLEERTINFSAQASTPTSSAQSTSNSNEILPAWVGTLAKGNLPQSELPLPEGICNGDIIIGQDNLLYFIWENTKSRIWFPATVDEKEVQSIPDGSDTDRQIVGQTQPDAGLGHLIVTTKADIYWLDTVRGMKYPLTAMPLLYDDLNSIPTAYGEQYFPVFR